MDKLKVVFDFIFSSYKRVASILVVMAIVLAIPITTSLLGQQQDIRQRASSGFLCDYQAVKMRSCDRTQLGTFVEIDWNSNERISCSPIPQDCISYFDNEPWNIPYRCNPPSGGWCPTTTPTQFSKSGTICIADAKACLDGSYVSRTGPNCEFAPCPTTTPTPTCTPEPACLRSNPPCALEPIPPPGGWCRPTTPAPTETSSNCTLRSRGDTNCDGKIDTDDFNIWRDGFLYQRKTCPTPPACPEGGLIIGDPAPGSGNICPAYSCKPGTVRAPTPPPNTCNGTQPDSAGNCPAGCVNYGVPLGCVSQEYMNYCSSGGMCPICLSKNTKIETPKGDRNVQDMKVGDWVYSIDSNSKKIAVKILKVGNTYVGNSHKILTIKLSDGRSLSVSPGHPTADGRDVATLKTEHILDGSKIKNISTSNYNYEYTYDLLPDSTTGSYFANGILMGSTLKK